MKKKEEEEEEEEAVCMISWFLAEASGFCHVASKKMQYPSGKKSSYHLHVHSFLHNYW